MTPTNLDSALLQAVLLVDAFKHDDATKAQAALIYIGLRGGNFNAAMIPEGVISEENREKMPGLAVAALRSLGIVTVTDQYVKSPKPSAKGRPVRVLVISDENRAKAKAWLRANGFTVEEGQGELFGKEAA